MEVLEQVLKDEAPARGSRKATWFASVASLRRQADTAHSLAVATALVSLGDGH